MFEFVTEWLRGMLPDQRMREVYEEEKFRDRAKHAQEVRQYRTENPPFFGYMPKKLSNFIENKLRYSIDPAYQLTFQHTKMNAWETVLDIIEHGNLSNARPKKAES